MNRIPVYRCPSQAFVEECGGPRAAMDAALALESYALLDAHGSMPDGGAWIDQAASWRRACGVISSERSLIQEERKRRLEAQQKAAAALHAAKGGRR